MKVAQIPFFGNLTHNNVCRQPCVVVKQLTLDIEHYLGETVRTCADWGHRYLSFTDYDVQIVEVAILAICLCADPC